MHIMEIFITFMQNNWAIIAPILVSIIYLVIKITPDENPRWGIVDLVLGFIANLLRDKSKIKDNKSGRALSHKEINAFSLIDSDKTLKQKVSEFINLKKTDK